MVMGIFPRLEKREVVVMIIGIPPSRKGDGVAMTIHNHLLRKYPSSSEKEGVAMVIGIPPLPEKGME